MKAKNEQNNGVPQQGGAAQTQPVLDPLQPTASNGPCTNAATHPGGKLTNGQDNTGPSQPPPPKAHRRKTRMGFVYALQMSDTNRWKIGWVKSHESLKDHLARLRRGCGQRLEVRALKATRMAEKNRLRWAMIMDWGGGDWFQWNRTLQQFVDENPFEGRAAPAHCQDS